MPTEEKYILDPLDEFNTIYKQAHHDYTSALFEELLVKSKINVEENQETIKKHKELTSKINDTNKILKNNKNGRIALIILSVVMFVITFIFIIVAVYAFKEISELTNIGDTLTSSKYYDAAKSIINKGTLTGVLMIVFGTILLAGGIVILCIPVKLLKNKINDINDTINDLKKKDDEITNEAKKQVLPLLYLFDEDMPKQLITKTIPIIKFDRLFDVEKLCLMIDKYGYEEDTKNDTSTLNLQSGDINGNPFLIRRTINTYMEEKIYTGSITIYWTTYSEDSDGNTIAQQHSEVLTATVTEPAPVYYNDTKLIYSNEAAPNLSFSRSSNMKLKNMTDKKIDKYVKKKSKEFDKLSNKSMNNNPENSFEKLSNEKFDTLFNATNRNNEREFRLLFTPLAQQNMTKLMLSKEPYGDDFSFRKYNYINVIQCAHSCYRNYSTDISNYFDIDINEIKNKFINFNDDYFQSLYFDFAPLFAIPLYTQYKTFEYIYNQTYNRNFTAYQEEELANEYKNSVFEPEDCDTKVILKTSISKKNDLFDTVDITSYGYHEIPRITEIPVFGGDGETHLVPVEWIEYKKVSKKSQMNVLDCYSNENTIEKLIARNKSLEKILEPYIKNHLIVNKRNLLSIVSDQSNKTQDIIDVILNSIKKKEDSILDNVNDCDSKQ